MKYIKIKFNLTNVGTEPFESYGWESVWNLKTQMVGGRPIEHGEIVNFKPVTVQADGKCLILATEKNIKTLKAMLEKKQIRLAPGESLETATEAPKPVEDAWPSEPGIEPEHPEDEVAEEAVVVKPKSRRKAVDLNPDKE